MYAKKRYGQNFLKSKVIAKRIVDSLKIKKDDIIIEIGPGYGVLTEYLYKYPKYLAIEIDGDLITKLEEKFPGIKIVNNDFLKEELSQYGKNVDYIGNLPYYIVSPIIFKIIENGFKEAVFMVQKEVARRMVSEPKNKQYGFLTAFVNYFCEVKLLFNVGRANFYPIPKVDSSVVELQRNQNPYDARFVEFLKRSFAMKRKMLVNNLKRFYDIELIKESFEKLNIPLKSRAEEIDYNLLRRLYNALAQH